MNKKEYACKRANELYKKFGACIVIIKEKDDYELWIRGEKI